MNTIQIISITTAVVLAGIILLIGFKTNLLRERNSENSPYSFSKFQFWLWTFIICPLFAIHWGWHFPSNPSINQTSLILLGISGGITLTSGILTQSLVSNKKAEIEKLKNTSTSLVDENQLLSTLKFYKNESKGFWNDILTSNDNNMPVERLHNLVFTFVYIVIYITYFFSYTENEVFPKVIDPLTKLSTTEYSFMNFIDFEPYAFVLMGISSSSYLIGKSINR